MDRSEPSQRGQFVSELTIPTRWLDNDVYGHVNNVVFYAYFDTVINEYLIRAGGLDIAAGAAIGLCVESQCRFYEPVAFPELLSAGLRVAKLGRTSVRYEVGIFRAESDRAVAEGYFVHVFVDRQTRRPTPLPDAVRAALETIAVDRS